MLRISLDIGSWTQFGHFTKKNKFVLQRRVVEANMVAASAEVYMEMPQRSPGCVENDNNNIISCNSDKMLTISNDNNNLSSTSTISTTDAMTKNPTFGACTQSSAALVTDVT